MLEQAIIERITTFGNLPELIGGRCYFSELPKGVTYPAIKFSFVDEGYLEEVEAAARAGLTRTRVKFDICLKKPGPSNGLDMEIVLAWRQFRGVLEGVSIYNVTLIHGTTEAEAPSARTQAADGSENIEFYFWYPKPEQSTPVAAPTPVEAPASVQASPLDEIKAQEPPAQEPVITAKQEEHNG